MAISIITGGQTGVDTGALKAAVAAKVPANGLFPAGWKREQPVPQWLKEISTCIESSNYDARTREVMRRAQACLIITNRNVEDTPGTKLTHHLAKDEGAHLWVFQTVHNPAYHKAECGAIAYWLRSLEKSYNGKLTLMVAGPREGKWPEGTITSLDLMTLVFKQYHALTKELSK